ncbi:DNA replication/repair protein RecF [Swingsia samuiensis]|uniref:DNA replication and repair protein RecF n=1 Tax=Swingsia samuiensis TaxID=1293412 RepID=A0A4Y6UF03_9PROT|nr:DNA replication/repair protein RecF [Swingsia samuiensis]QDH16133.1 DNA replication/repair protein RecF [Swingsia samuiensis]
MKLNRLTLTNFRNYQRSVWTPQSHISVLTGENGSGKTNLLEAISLLGPGKGLRGASLHTLCNSNAQEWGIAADITSRFDHFLLATGSSLTEKKRRNFQLNGSSIRSQAEIASFFPSVWLTPQMDRFFTEGAGGRRRFFDRLVMALSPDHARQMAAHEKSIASRNRILAEREHESQWLNSIEDSIARHAVAASAARLLLIEKMNEHPFQSSQFPQSLLHVNCLIIDKLLRLPALEVEDWLRSSLKKSREKDKLKNTSSFGAHKADFFVSDKATGRHAELSSSGQQKAMLIGIILSHARLIEANKGVTPAILLDEPLLHLDQQKRESLLTSLTQFQTPIILTGTDPEPFLSLSTKAQFFRVQNGQIHST